MGATFDVTAILKANVSDFTRGLKEAQMSLESLKKQSGSSFDKISQSLSSVGGAITAVGAGMTAGFTAPVVGAIGGVVKAYAGLEQAIGGIETMFKGSADTVISNSESAYKRAGVSGVKYMEQVTSFSASLLQGLGGDTAAAARYADMAIVDMSDNANKFGSNISDIQNAYQGFAKDNYTMLDNLKLGYGGTATEMARLVNDSGVLNGEFEATAENVKDIPFDKLIQAIHITQEKLDITGTTAKEASETVSGSFDSMKAAAENLAAGLGQKDADIKGLLSNLGETIKNFVRNIKNVVLTLWNNLPLAPWQKWLGAIVVAAGPFLTAIGTIVSTIGKVISIINGMSGVFTAVGTALAGLSAPVLIAIAAIAALIAGFVYLFNTNEQFRLKVLSVFAEVKSFIFQSVQAIVSFVMNLWGQMVSWWNENQELIRQTAETVWNAIKVVIETVLTALAPVFETAWNLITTIISTAWEMIKVIVGTALTVVLGIIKAVMQMINGDWSGAWETIKSVLGTVWEGIKSLVQIAWNGLVAILQAGLGFLKSLWDLAWNTLTTILKSAWENIKSVISNAVENVKNTVSNGWNHLVSTVTNLGNNIISAVRNSFDNAVNTARNFVGQAISAGADLISGFVQGVANAAGRLISAVSDAVGGAINAAKNLLGIHSPSRVFRQFGLFTDEGFVIGVNAGTGKVLKSMAGMAQGAISAFAGQDVAGSLQSELGAVDGELGRLTAYDPSVSFNGGTLTVGQQAADIVLKMGNTVYRAFTEDITNAQEMELILDHY